MNLKITASETVVVETVVKEILDSHCTDLSTTIFTVQSIVKRNMHLVFLFLQYLSKFPRADWLVAIVYKSTDNKNDVRCSVRAFSTENQR